MNKIFHRRALDALYITTIIISQTPSTYAYVTTTTTRTNHYCCSTSPLFRRQSPPLINPFVSFPYPTRILHQSTTGSSSNNSNNNNNSPNNDDIIITTTATPVPTENTISTIKSTIRTLLQQIDALGQELKPMAITAYQMNQSITDSRSKKLFYTLKSCVLYLMFIGYRGYRGIFVILPAVFKEVYRKMGRVIDHGVFDDDDDDDNDDTATTTTTASRELDTQDINPKTGKVRLRTRLTVSVLATIVTLTYVVSGLMKVLFKFVGTITETSSIVSSLEAAADEVIVNESKIQKLAGGGDDDVNGVEDDDD